MQREEGGHAERVGPDGDVLRYQQKGVVRGGTRFRLQGRVQRLIDFSGEVMCPLIL